MADWNLTIHSHQNFHSCTKTFQIPTQNYLPFCKAQACLSRDWQRDLCRGGKQRRSMSPTECAWGPVQSHTEEPSTITHSHTNGWQTKLWGNVHTASGLLMLLQYTTHTAVKFCKSKQDRRHIQLMFLNFLRSPSSFTGCVCVSQLLSRLWINNPTSSSEQD